MIDRVNSEREERLLRIIDELERIYGIPRFEPDGDGIDHLVRTILSQNTSDVNRDRAYKALKNCFKSWDEVVGGGADLLSRVIKSGGLGRIKAQRIIRSLSSIKSKRGSYDLGFLRDMPGEKALEFLISLDGVGLKTAACVLLFSYGVPVFPVDTHILRVSKRLGLVPERSDLDKAFWEMNRIVPRDKMYSLHKNLIRHGRLVCKSGKPLCDACAISGLCCQARFTEGLDGTASSGGSRTRGE